MAWVLVLCNWSDAPLGREKWQDRKITLSLSEFVTMDAWKISVIFNVPNIWTCRRSFPEMWIRLQFVLVSLNILIDTRHFLWNRKEPLSHKCALVNSIWKWIIRISSWWTMEQSEISMSEVTELDWPKRLHMAMPKISFPVTAMESNPRHRHERGNACFSLISLPVPIVTLLFEGGEDSIKTIYHDLRENISVIIINVRSEDISVRTFSFAVDRLI